MECNKFVIQIRSIRRILNDYIVTVISNIITYFHRDEANFNSDTHPYSIKCINSCLVKECE